MRRLFLFYSQFFIRIISAVATVSPTLPPSAFPTAPSIIPSSSPTTPTVSPSYFPSNAPVAPPPAPELFPGILWVIARAGENHADVCARIGRNPYVTLNFNWNATTFEDVVTTKLFRNVSSSVNNPFGIRGCCAPGLWCDDTGCFTQGFGEQFVNYGWLNDDDTALPVFTCATSTTTRVAIRSLNLAGGKFDLYGQNFGDDESELYPFVNLAEGRNVESCNCISCSGGDSSTCPLGTLCHTTNSGSSYCLTACAGTGDFSCPCSRTCTTVSDSTGRTTRSVCLPSGQDETLCDLFSGHLQCDINTAYQADDVSNPIGLSLISGNRIAQNSLDSNDLVNGFCNSVSLCWDGDISTADLCDGTTGYCSYDSSYIAANEVTSTMKTLKERQTPYMYHSFYATGLSSEQSAFKTAILELGTVSLVSDLDTFPLETVEMSFNVLYFGNLVSEISLSPDGVVVFPPVNTCNEVECPLFVSSSNVISPWNADWNLLDNGDTDSVYYYEQTAGDGSDLFGINATAFHVLFDGLLDSRGRANSFASSIYADGSIKLSFITTPGASTSDDFHGLWGSYASGEVESYLRYHQETVDSSMVVSGSEMVYCPVNGTACMRDSCVAAEETLHVWWNGTTGCNALGTESPIVVECQWVGGLATTEATVVPSENGETASGYVTCPVPVLDFENEQVLTVDLVVKINDSSPVSFIKDYDLVAGTKSVYGVAIGRNAELVRTSLMVTYYTNVTDRPSESCGCNVITSVGVKQCDSVGVCGGTNSAGTIDCFGSLFGSAYQDACSRCTMGYTGLIPVFRCSSSSSDSGFGGVISTTVILLLIICCMTFLTTAVSYSVRRMLHRRAMQDALSAENELAMQQMMGSNRGQPAGGAAARGLSEFERDALGEVVYSDQFYQQHLDHQKESKGLAFALIQEGDEEDEENGGNLTHANSSKTPDCSICLLEFEAGGVCRVLPDPCGHIFHKECIDQWLQQSLVCPLCKRSIRDMLNGELEAPKPANSRRSSSRSNNRSSRRSNSRRSSSRSGNRDSQTPADNFGSRFMGAISGRASDNQPAPVPQAPPADEPIVTSDIVIHDNGQSDDQVFNI